MSRVLPQMPWQARGLWAMQPKALAVLLFGLALLGVGEAMLVLGNLGAAPWVVLAQGLAQQTGLNVGVTTFIISIGVMLLWIPLRLRPGLGTLANMVVIAAVLGLITRFVPPPAADAWLLRGALCLGGIGMVGMAAALYLTCHMGAGPRDGLMVGICLKTGWRVGIVRTMIEATVCFLGWLLGGTFGVGTILFAFGVGWAVQWSLQGMTWAVKIFQAA